ncbi:hypothetical protein IAT38_007478 [Cryptococcus sp. DSM 104549]
MSLLRDPAHPLPHSSSLLTNPGASSAQPAQSMQPAANHHTHAGMTNTAPPTAATTSKHRPTSSSSRNDLFTTSWKPEIPPPRPLSSAAGDGAPSGESSTAAAAAAALGMGHAATITSPIRRRDFSFERPSPTRSPHFASASTSGLAGSAAASASAAGVDEFGVTKHPQRTQARTEGSPRTSSFFDVSVDGLAPPPPAPRLTSTLPAHAHPTFPPGSGSTLGSASLGGSGAGAGPSTPASAFTPSPLNLSRASSLRRTVPPPLSLSRTLSSSGTEPPREPRQRSWDSYDSASPPGSPAVRADDALLDPLSPLHQSPQLPPLNGAGADWKPPMPPSADDIELRLMPSATYLLGEGRYAKVYLAAYKRVRKRKAPRGNLLGRVPTMKGMPGAALGKKDGEAGEGEEGEGEGKEVNEDGDGLVGGSWRLCAAKRLAPDRDSQTMGLREAFFLNRLSGRSPATREPAAERDRTRLPRSSQQRVRAVSPLRDSHAHAYVLSDELDSTPQAKPRRNGSVYVAKLIAVKEDFESGSHAGHARSASDAVKGDRSGSSSGVGVGGPGGMINSHGSLVRQRSSTMMATNSPPASPVDPVAAKVSAGCSRPDLASLASFPSFPSLAQAVRQEYSAPSLSRLVLLLEHAPLGTLDRLLRTSPQLVGRRMWERWAREGVEALEWVHSKGVVHADVKPGNLLLTTDLHLRLSDFGSSLLIHPSHPPTDGLGLGTLPFSPPELIDPSQPFSFPVDVFALGATLYQCITGREPFRGARAVEIMHHVRKGGLWAYEERERLGRVGEPAEVGSVGGSPYPSAWRGYPDGASFAATGAGVRRAGSLRVPNTHSRDHLTAGTSFDPSPSPRPRLNRMTSAESIRANDEAGSAESPAGIKLWAKWVKDGAGVDPVTALLSDEEMPLSPTAGLSRGSSMRRGASGRSIGSTGSVGTGSGRSRASSLNASPIEPHSHQAGRLDIPAHQTVSVTVDSPISVASIPEDPTSPPPIHTHLSTIVTIAPTPSPTPSPKPTPPIPARQLTEPYEDGSPSMLFLDGRERVREAVRNVLMEMLEPDQWLRMTAVEVREKWDELGVGSGDCELDQEGDDWE